ncbi:sodium channel protein Nach-like [Bacillus rossius redtenbacheri]|uniref:sodium channel protein Nach-like n=1 Tax=Bacillus rossius redtenbacheri TaxID=93214 RepID=UPI002FDD6B79
MYAIAEEEMSSLDDDCEAFSLLKASWKYQARQFFQNSTLHGVRYIRQECRPFYERFMWFCFTLTGAISTLIIIASVWNKFQTNPTITGLDTDFHNWDVMFPAVWLCPLDSFNESQADKFIHTMWPETEEESKKYRHVAQVLANLSFTNLYSIRDVPPDVATKKKEMKRLLKQVVYRCEDLLTDCTFANLGFDCCSLWQAVHTEVGHCYAFNSRQAFLRNHSNAELTFSPKTISATDESWSLKFNMKNLKMKGEDSSSAPVKVYLLPADDIPVVDIFPQHMWDRHVSKLSFSLKETYTTEDTRQLSISQRQCIYKDEVKLDTSPMYTYTACRSECRMARAKKLCGCVPFFYPSSEQFKKCNLDGLKCLGHQPEGAWHRLGCKCELGCANTVYEVAKLTDTRSVHPGHW